MTNDPHNSLSFLRPVVVIAPLLVTAASASPAVLGVHYQTRTANLQPLTFSLTTPTTPLTRGVDLAGRFDTTIALGASAPAPAPSALLIAQLAQPLNSLGMNVTPFVGGGIGAITFTGGTHALTWVARGGVNVTLPDLPVGLTVEAQATRAGFGWSVGLSLSLPQDSK